MSLAKLGEVRVTGLILIAANLVPIYGVIVHDWEVFPLILLYWLENLMLGALQIVRIAIMPLPAEVPVAASIAGKAFMVPFFTVHYFGFCMVHGVFVFTMFGDGVDPFGMGFFPNVDGILGVVREYHLALPLFALALSHLISLLRHAVFAGERQAFNGGPAIMMGGIYKRIVVLHIAILFGSFFVMALGSPWVALLLLVALKTAFDYGAHSKEHKEAAALLEGRRSPESDSVWVD